MAASGVAGGSGGSGGVRVRDVLGQPRELRGEVDGVLAHHGGQLAVHLQGGSGVEVPRVRVRVRGGGAQGQGQGWRWRGPGFAAISTATT